MLSGNSPAVKVVIVGGSLGGLFNAIALRALGYEVDVFEKSSGLMADRGAGIVFQPEVGKFFNRYGIALIESIVIPVKHRRYLNVDGSVIEEGPLPQAMTSWDAMYRKLRAYFGDKNYHSGVRFIGFDEVDEKVTARFDDGRMETCDLLIGADGPGSTVRKQLLPTVNSEYAGYVAWRGVVLEHQALELADEFTDRFTFFQARHTHILCYLIPGPDGSLLSGQRRMNWVWYRNAATGSELDAVLTDNTGRRRQFSVPQGLVSTSMAEQLRRQARSVLPPTFRRLVELTQEPFVQTIHDLAVPTMAFGQACLTGDAAFVPRPHTAFSTAKAAANAMSLADAFTVSGGDIPEGLIQWEASQLDLGQRLRTHGQLLGDRSQFG